jgi:hypothetical protein
LSAICGQIAGREGGGGVKEQDEGKDYRSSH